MTQLRLSFGNGARRADTASGRRIVLAGRVLNYRFVRSRRRTIGIVVRQGEVEARAPWYVPIAAVEGFLREKQDWITKRLAEPRPQIPPLRWSEGEMLPVHGRPIRLTGSAGEVRLCGTELWLPHSDPGRWRELAIDWLRATALTVFHRRVGHYAERLGLGMPQIALSNARTQWGSCWRHKGPTGRILLNWRLVHMPPHVADYVVAHEVAHLRELNHSPRFWAVVESLMPDYRHHRRQLNQLGRDLPTL